MQKKNNTSTKNCLWLNKIILNGRRVVILYKHFYFAWYSSEHSDVAVGTGRVNPRLVGVPLHARDARSRLRLVGNLHSSQLLHEVDGSRLVQIAVQVIVVSVEKLLGIDCLFGRLSCAEFLKNLTTRFDSFYSQLFVKLKNI